MEQEGTLQFPLKPPVWPLLPSPWGRGRIHTARCSGYQLDHDPRGDVESLIQRLFSFRLVIRKRWERWHTHSAAVRRPVLLLFIESIVCTAVGPKKVPVAKLLVEGRQSSERSWGSGGRRYIQTDRKLQMLQRKWLTCSRTIPLTGIQSCMACPWSQGDLTEEHETKL